MTIPISRISAALARLLDRERRKETCQHDEWVPVDRYDWMGAEYVRCVSCGVEVLQLD